jgi:hypothetical protein
MVQQNDAESTATPWPAVIDDIITHATLCSYGREISYFLIIDMP